MSLQSFLVLVAALPLRYLDFGPGFTILAGFLRFLPRLAEVRIGSDAPPGMKGSLQRQGSSGRVESYRSTPLQ